jgi:hypothetical protein
VLLALVLACGPDAKVTQDSGAAEVLPDDPRFAFGDVRACADPRAEATWTEVTGDWASTYPEVPPDVHSGLNPGAMALLGGPGTWALAWVQPDGIAMRRLSDGLGGLFGGGRPAAALAITDLDGDGIDDLLFAGGAVAVAWSAGSWDAPRERPTPLHDPRDNASTTDMAAGDIDADGDMDLLVAWSSPVHDDPTTMRGTVLRNDGARTFTELPIAAEPAVWGPAFDFSLRDVDGDGILDAYLCNDMGFQVAPNRLFLGDGAGGFTARSGDGLDLRLSCMGTSWGDVDADGALEVYIAESVRHVLLKEAADGTWYQITDAMGLGGSFATGYMSWGSTLLDFDNDGRMELVDATGDFWVREAQANAPWWFEQDADGQFEEIGAARGLPREAHARGVVGADVNDDGVLDLMLSDAVRTPRIYLSDGCTTDAWLEIDAPAGSEVIVEAGGVVRAARVDTESGWGSAGPRLAHVGLGATGTVDRLTVRSPGRAAAVVEGPFAARRRVTVTP